MTTMVEVAERTNNSIEAIAKEQGKEMKNAYAVSIRDGVATIPIRGPLFRYANLMTMICGASSYELLAKDFNQALNDPSISAIVFDIDSPGGEVNGCSEFADMIFNARGQKPIIAYASGSCCSGAYWIASSCDEIKVTDTAVLGSIGVVSIYRKDEDKKKCIEIVSSQSPNKRPDLETDEGKAKIQARIDDLANVFINKVARNRNVSADEVIKNFGGGDVFIGQSAVRVGLADSISSYEETISGFNLKENIMNEREIVLKERQRATSVLAKSTGKEAVAQALLSKTDLDAETIVSILETVPTQSQGNAFEQAMATIKNPDITPAAETEESTESMAIRIANSLKGA